MSNNLEKLNSFVQELEVKMGQTGQASVLLDEQENLIGGEDTDKNKVSCLSTKNQRCVNTGRCDQSSNGTDCKNTGFCDYTNNSASCMTGGSGTGGTTGGASGHLGIGFPSLLF